MPLPSSSSSFDADADKKLATLRLGLLKAVLRIENISGMAQFLGCQTEERRPKSLHISWEDSNCLSLSISPSAKSAIPEPRLNREHFSVGKTEPIFSLIAITSPAAADNDLPRWGSTAIDISID